MDGIRHTAGAVGGQQGIKMIGVRYGISSTGQGFVVYERIIVSLFQGFGDVRIEGNRLRGRFGVQSCRPQVVHDVAAGENEDALIP